jgi:polygalacturonase
MLVLGACRRITVSNVKLLGFVSSSDGCDIVGSQQIRVQNCFFRNGDDCVVLKSLDLRGHDSAVALDHTQNVEDIEVVGCAFMSNRGGQAMEIGHELRCDYVRNVRFHDCDVLAVRDFGSAFGIHNADHATVQDILYEDIRVEHHYDKLVDFRIVRTRWSRDKQRGQVRNVTLRGISAAISEYNPGYTVSIIGGFDAKHTIENVHFENFCLTPTLYEADFAGFDNTPRKVLAPDDIDLYVRHASNITFA